MEYSEESEIADILHEKLEASILNGNVSAAEVYRDAFEYFLDMVLVSGRKHAANSQAFMEEIIANALRAKEIFREE